MVDRRRALEAVGATKGRLDALRAEQRIAGSAFEAAVVVASATGSSQREIAARAGVSQPYIAQILAANRSRFVPRSKLGQVLASRRAQVVDIVRSYGAENVVVFGSVARGDDGPGSDIDLMVDIPEGMGLFTLAKMEREVRDALGVDVDLVPSRLVRAEVAASAKGSAVAL